MEVLVNKIVLMTAVSAMALGLAQTAAAQPNESPVSDSQLNVGVEEGASLGNANTGSTADNDVLDIDLMADNNNIGAGNAAGEGSQADNDVIDNKGGTIDNDGLDVNAEDLDYAKSLTVNSGNTAIWKEMWYSGNSAVFDHSIHSNIAMLSQAQLGAAVTGINMFQIIATGQASGGAGAAIADGVAASEAIGVSGAKADGNSLSGNLNHSGSRSGAGSAALSGGNTGGTANNSGGNADATGGPAANNAATGIAIGGANASGPIPVTGGGFSTVAAEKEPGGAANKTNIEDGGGDAAANADRGGTAAGDGGSVGETGAESNAAANAESGKAEATAESSEVANKADAKNDTDSSATNKNLAAIEGATQHTKLSFDLATGNLGGAISGLNGVNPVMQNAGFAHNQNTSLSVNAMVGSVNGAGGIGN